MYQIIYKQINFYDFAKEFKASDQENYFSDKGLRALYDHLIQEECEVERELDILVICDKYMEYKSLDEINEDYDRINHEDGVFKSSDDLYDYFYYVIELDNGGYIISEYEY